MTGTGHLVPHKSPSTNAFLFSSPPNNPPTLLIKVTKVPPSHLHGRKKNLSHSSPSCKTHRDQEFRRAFRIIKKKEDEPRARARKFYKFFNFISSRHKSLNALTLPFNAIARAINRGVGSCYCCSGEPGRQQQQHRE